MISKQEMFDRAYRGLASQGWMQSLNGTDDCVYLNSEGMRCAWGWVDQSLISEHVGTIDDLRLDGIGIAATLEDEQLAFASLLQVCHDDKVGDRESLRRRFDEFASAFNLTIPELP